ncbi:MAG: site-specific DNA-methyltransferase [Chloroflexota bacterium]|nr:site-specific DNA-methyltransferase [Chloroflexota bacterium]MDE2931307.1 site-specific DNA-methyltransferase [Chloroflexota bacterium]
MTANDVRGIVLSWIHANIPEVSLGLPEFDDRLDQWRIALLAPHNGRDPVGEVRVANGQVVFSTDLDLAKERCRQHLPAELEARTKHPITFRPIPSRIVLGDASEALADYPPGTVQLVFTSPPYFNAKPEYHESAGYGDYLDLLRDIFSKCHDMLSEGRFLVVNTSPILIRRAHRSTSSRRLPITFDLHAVLDELGFEFIDDIIWQKPEGAGWHLGRGRRFAADRQPLQYKPVTVTENVVVYRKRTDKLIDWNLRNHPDPDAIRASLIEDGYERTNVWQLQPAHHRQHPAVFPESLAERVIRYYSFIGDMVLDPFAGVGTTGRVAGRLGRRFFMVEKSLDYFELQCMDIDIQRFFPDILDFEFFAGSS